MPNKDKNILVTGAAGFIGFSVTYRLLKQGCKVIGLDNLSDYYDVNLKKDRLKELAKFDNYTNVQVDIADSQKLFELFKKYKPNKVIHLAAQAGVRYSLENPDIYIQTNLVGFANMCEACRSYPVEHFVYASSSSVYGSNQNFPFSTEKPADHPISLYAATKRSNELIAHSYSHLFSIPVTGLRFFTVYGPWGRPDMALFKFTKNILAGEEIEVYNNGQHKRDFTYIDDVVDGVVRVLNSPPTKDNSYNYTKPTPDTSSAPFKVYNVANGTPVLLMDYIHALEDALRVKAKIKFLPMQPGDVKETAANIEPLKQELGYQPKTPVKTGVQKFVDWYKEYYKN